MAPVGPVQFSLYLSVAVPLTTRSHRLPLRKKDYLEIRVVDVGVLLHVLQELALPLVPDYSSPVLGHVQEVGQGDGFHFSDGVLLGQGDAAEVSRQRVALEMRATFEKLHQGNLVRAASGYLAN